MRMIKKFDVKYNIFGSRLYIADSTNWASTENPAIARIVACDINLL